jgi:hypothetical protein
MCSGVADGPLQNQNLPLGPDCQKYLTMTPKAPPDIDEWMIDPPASNISTSFQITRNIILSIRPLNDSISNTASMYKQKSLRGFWEIPWDEWAFALSDWRFWAVLGASLVIWLGLVDFLNNPARYVKLLARPLSVVESWIGRKITSRLLILLLVWSLITSFYGCLYAFDSSSRHKSWSATSEFLDLCKTQRVWCSPNIGARIC